jgi:aspartate/methionine/tyrosine aminotransferase
MASGDSSRLQADSMTSELLARLTEFPFRRLAALLAPHAPPAGLRTLDLALGEPQHEPPALLADTVARNAHLWNRYPPVAGTPELRQAAAGWLSRRYDLPDGAVDPERNLLTLAGTKEGLFSIASLVVPARKAGSTPAVLMPNPVYAVYYGAAVMAGAEPVLLPTSAENGFLPDLRTIPSATLDRTALLYLCTPANPQGTAADPDYLRHAVGLARKHGFVLAVDECYAEIWDRAPPAGTLTVAWNEDRSFDSLLVFHSLSKRSSAAGLRSGFVAGDPALIAAFLKLRAYSAPVQPMPLAAAAAALWRDETHVGENRTLYRRKIDVAERHLSNRFGFYRPPGGFFLWLDVGDGESAALRLWREAGLRVLPGGYLGAPDAVGGNPGASYIRLALVHDEATTQEAVQRLAGVLG